MALGAQDELAAVLVALPNGDDLHVDVGLNARGAEAPMACLFISFGSGLAPAGVLLLGTFPS